MANFILLYSGGRMPESETEQRAVQREWDKWFSKVGSGLVDGGNPTTPMAKTIGPDGRIADVPSGSMVSGYSILKAESLNAAISLAKDCPVLKDGARIMVFETFNPGGM